MATIRQLPSGNWNVQVRIKGLPSQRFSGGKGLDTSHSKGMSRTFSTEKEAQDWARQAEATSTEIKQHTIYTLGMAYCDSHLKGKGSYAHAVQIVEQLRIAFPQPIQAITPQLINDFKIKRLESVKTSTCRTQLAFMSRFFRYAKRGLLIDLGNPVTEIDLPKPSKASDKVVSEDELKLMLKHLSPTMALIAELAYETAMRRSEILKLTMDCLHLEERIADVIDGKNGTRSVPLTLRAVELFREAVLLAKVGRLPKGRLFDVLPHSVSQAVRRARKVANLDDSVKLHQLRHTRITNVAKKGFNNAQIMIVSGHRDTRSVARYSHLNAKDVLHLID